MNRRSFFRCVIAAAIAPALAPLLSSVKLPAESAAPTFDIQMLSLPIVHADFCFTSREYSDARVSSRNIA